MRKKLHRRTDIARQLQSKVANAKRHVSIKEATGHGRDNGIKKLKRELHDLCGRRK